MGIIRGDVGQAICQDSKHNKHLKFGLRVIVPANTTTHIENWGGVEFNVQENKDDRKRSTCSPRMRNKKINFLARLARSRQVERGFAAFGRHEQL